jgi:two-component system, OmpR family, sensor kinase
MSRGPQYLARRVVISTIMTAAIGGALTAILAIVAVDRLVASHGDQRLTGATVTLSGEIDENETETETEQDPLGEILEDENQEIATSGIRLAVFEGKRLVAGDPSVPWVDAGTCSTLGDLGTRVRACSRQHRDWLLVSMQSSDESGLRWLYLLAGLGALLMSGLLGAIASTRLTRWALRPLTDLGEAIRHMPASSSAADELGKVSECVEVEEIRRAIVNLMERVEVLLSHAHRFAAGAAHELRTPLTTIAGELELLAEEAGADAQRETLRKVHVRVTRLGALVERLLVLASPLAEQEHRFEALALSDLLSELVSELPEEQRRRVRLNLEGEGLTRGEPSLLRSVFANALDNALKFSGNAPVEVRLSESGGDSDEEDAGSVDIEVHDRGPGVPIEERERVFRPLYRANPTFAAGHGLGLALIGHIVRAHGGTAAFVDADAGALLRVSLPAWQSGGDEEHAEVGRVKPARQRVSVS